MIVTRMEAGVYLITSKSDKSRFLAEKKANMHWSLEDLVNGKFWRFTTLKQCRDRASHEITWREGTP